MPQVYKCVCCKYDTTRLFNYNKHIKTKSHIDNSATKNLSVNISKISNISKIHKCDHCKKTLSSVRRLDYHYTICKVKIAVDIKRLEDDAIRLSKEKEDITKDFIEYLKSNKNINVEGDVTLNFNYIAKNYNDAPNYEDVMAQKLSRAETVYIEDRGAAVSRENLIYTRCIKNIEKEQRSFHCVDYARDKFAVRTKNRWEEDIKAEKILRIGSQIMTQFFDYDDKNIDINEKVYRLQQIRDMNSTDRKAMKFLGKQSLLKNNILE